MNSAFFITHHALLDLVISVLLWGSALVSVRRVVDELRVSQPRAWRFLDGSSARWAGARVASATCGIVLAVPASWTGSTVAGPTSGCSSVLMTLGQLVLAGGLVVLLCWCRPGSEHAPIDDLASQAEKAIPMLRSPAGYRHATQPRLGRRPGHVEGADRRGDPRSRGDGFPPPPAGSIDYRRWCGPPPWSCRSCWRGARSPRSRPTCSSCCSSGRHFWAATSRARCTWRTSRPTCGQAGRRRAPLQGHRRVDRRHDG